MLKGVGIDLFNNKDSKNNGKSLKIFAIGNQNILLIVSNFGHFDLRKNQLSGRFLTEKIFISREKVQNSSLQTEMIPKDLKNTISFRKKAL